MTESYQFDVLYLGAGHGAFDGAVPLAKSGKKVAIIEADKIGGNLSKPWMQRENYAGQPSSTVTPPRTP